MAALFFLLMVCSVSSREKPSATVSRFSTVRLPVSADRSWCTNWNREGADRVGLTLDWSIKRK